MNIEQVKEEAKKRFGKDITDEEAKAWLDAHPAGELQNEELENVAGGGCGGEKERFFNSNGQCKCGCQEYIKYGNTCLCAECERDLGPVNFTPRPQIKIPK